MSIKKFIKNVTKMLGLDDIEGKSKKKSLKKLLDKLEARQKSIKNTPKKKLSIKEKKALSEERKIINLQIKKAKKILD